MNWLRGSSWEYRCVGEHLGLNNVIAPLLEVPGDDRKTWSEPHFNLTSALLEMVNLVS